MSSFRQIAANRRNARLSTGPSTEEGKRWSRQNAIRHGLTAETVIAALEDVDDYAAFELAVTSDYDARTAVERELVLRLASLLWRLRRASSIEAGLFEIQARQLLQGRQQRRAHQRRQGVIARIYLNATGDEEREQQGHAPYAEDNLGVAQTTANGVIGQSADLTCSFLRLNNLQTFPLDRLSRYEATLWRQACQTLFTLRRISQHRP